MSEGSAVKKSLTDQIIEETLATLEEMDEFDSSTITQLIELASKGDLKKAPQVTRVIKPA